MRTFWLAIAMYSVFVISDFAQSPGDLNVKPPKATLPAPMENALKRFSAGIESGQIPPPPVPARPRSNGLCSIPLLEPRHFDRRGAFPYRMPSPKGHSLDHNQIAPPAPPCH